MSISDDDFFKKLTEKIHKGGIFIEGVTDENGLLPEADITPETVPTQNNSPQKPQK